MQCSNTIFWSRFSLYINSRYPWNEVDFLSEQANFSVSDQLGRNFPTVQNGSEKRKNLYLIKLLSKWKSTITKGHTSVLVFHFWDLELVLIDSALNSASVNFNLRFLKVQERYQENQPNLKMQVKIYWKCLLWS